MKLRVLILILAFLILLPAPVLAQQQQKLTEWFIEFRYKEIVGDCENGYSLAQKDWAIAQKILTVKTPTLETFYEHSDLMPVCFPGVDESPWGLSGYFYLDGEFSDISYSLYVHGPFPELRLRKGEEMPVSMGEFSCEIVIPAPIPSYDPQAYIERIKAEKNTNFDLDLIGDYEIPTSPILPLQIGGYRRDINLGGLINLKFFFYAMIMWRLFF